jgi:hypothetical protein
MQRIVPVLLRDNTSSTVYSKDSLCCSRECAANKHNAHGSACSCCTLHCQSCSCSAYSLPIHYELYARNDVHDVSCLRVALANRISNTALGYASAIRQLHCTHSALQLNDAIATLKLWCY